MFSVEIQFANRTETSHHADRTDAAIFATDLLDMFGNEKSEKWFDNERRCYIVTAYHLEITE